MPRLRQERGYMPLHECEAMYDVRWHAWRDWSSLSLGMRPHACASERSPAPLLGRGSLRRSDQAGVLRVLALTRPSDPQTVMRW